MGTKRDKVPMEQINFRVPADLAARLEKVAELLASDVSHVLRLMVAEQIERYEARAKRFAEDTDA